MGACDPKYGCRADGSWCARLLHGLDAGWQPAGCSWLPTSMPLSPPLPPSPRKHTPSLPHSTPGSIACADDEGYAMFNGACRLAPDGCNTTNVQPDGTCKECSSGFLQLANGELCHRTARV